tara:strand:- start:180 stop:719 length:540 start_codon:yes stop_codon:yes gene_type:complete
MRYKKLVSLFFVFFLLQGLRADTLEDFGWTKKVDDFEGTTSYLVSHENYAYSCDGSTLVGVYGLVSGELSKKTPLTLMYDFLGAKEVRRAGAFKWKGEDGSNSLEFECGNDYDDGWRRQCLVMAITPENADSLANTDFIRLDFTSINLDLKEEGSTSGCSKLYTETRRIASEYSKAINK